MTELAVLAYCSDPWCYRPGSLLHTEEATGEDKPWCPSHYSLQPGNMVSLTSVRGADSIADIPPTRPMEKIMAQNGTVAYVDTLPKCNFAHLQNAIPDAEYDFRTRDGRWAYGCARHWKMHRLHNTLGIGKGQSLILRVEVPIPEHPAGILTDAPKPKSKVFSVPPNEHDSSDLI